MKNRQLSRIEDNFIFHVFQADRFIDLNLYQCGWERCKPSHLFGPAVRNHFLFHYVLSGKGTLSCSGTGYPVEGGQGFVIFPGQITTYYADRDDPWEYIWLEFDGLRARESLTLAGLNENQPVFTPSATEHREILVSEMMHLVNNPEEAPLRQVGQAMILLDDLTRFSRSRIHSGNKNIRDFYIKEAIAYIEHNYRDEISVDEIATACGLNRSYFGRVFKDVMNVTPQHFLIHYRMSKASDLLSSTRLPIAEVSRSVGYENQLHFSRAFKSVYGQSPSEYRNTHYHGSPETIATSDPDLIIP